MKNLKLVALVALVCCGSSVFASYKEDMAKRERALSLLENLEAQESLVFTQNRNTATREKAHETFQEYAKLLKPLIPSTTKWSAETRSFQENDYLEQAIVQESLVFAHTKNAATREKAHAAFQAYVLLLKAAIQQR